MVRSKLPPLRKLSLISLLIVLLVSVIYYIKSPFLNKDALVQEVESALTTQNVRQLSRVLTSSDEDLVINETNTKVLMDYLQKNPESTQSLLTVLQEQSRYFDNLEESQTRPEQSQIQGFLTLKKNSKSWINHYTIEIDPVYLTIHTNSKDATLLVNGEQVVKANEPIYEKKVGPLLPGEYKVEAVLETNGTDLVEQKQVVLWNSDEEIKLHLNSEEVGFYSFKKDE